MSQRRGRFCFSGSAVSVATSICGVVCADEKAQCAVVDILCSIVFTEALRSCFARQVDSVAIIGCDFVLHFWHHGDFVARQT